MRAVAYPDTYLSSPILPVAVSVGAAYTIATLFASVYEMGVDTVLLSFCEVRTGQQAGANALNSSRAAASLPVFFGGRAASC